MKKTIYIAGGMRGYPKYNFDAFDEADLFLQKLGWKTINPAKIDREFGFDPEKDIPSKAFLQQTIIRDLNCIIKVDALVLLQGWEKSIGARAEFAVARWREIPIYLYPQMEEFKKDMPDMEKE